MSNLLAGLAIAGGLVLAGVMAHGAWTTRRNAPRVLRTAHAQLDEELPSTDDARVEPQFDDMALGGSTSAGGPLARTQPPSERRLGLDPLIDSIAHITLEHAVITGEAVLQHLPGTRRVGSKTFAVEGLSERSGLWEAPAPMQRYTALQSGVQLANRSGALNDIEFSEWVQKTQAFADAVDGVAAFADMREEVARGRELDSFAASHDAQLGVTVRARSAAWSTGYVQLHAARQGFVAGALPGRMVLPGAAGAAPVLVLQFDTQAALADDTTPAALRSVQLSLDVPQVDRGEQPFVRMRDVALAMAASMDGIITDDRGTVLSADALDTIGADLEVLYDALAERDLAAGSAQARRLFA